MKPTETPIPNQPKKDSKQDMSPIARYIFEDAKRIQDAYMKDLKQQEDERLRKLLNDLELI